MQLINEQEWQALPESAQKKFYDFFLFIKQRYSQSTDSEQQAELSAFSNHSANNITEWLDEKEDDVWK